MQSQVLAYFAEVARSCSIRTAAQKFNVAPSAVSRQIASLERELGLTLFERSARGMEPTAAGRIVLNFIAETEVRMVQMRSEIDDLTALNHGTVRLAVVEAVASDFLPQLMTEFRTLAPGIGFQVRVHGTHQIADSIVSEEAEIGLAFNVLDRDDLVLQGRIRQPLQLICRPGHALASRTTISLSDLDGVEVALPMRSFGIRYLIEQAALRSGVHLSIVCETDSLQAIKSFVSKSDVVSFMPPMTFAHELALNTLCEVSLSDSASEQASIDIITSRKHGLSAAAQAFLTTLQRHVR